MTLEEQIEDIWRQAEEQITGVTISTNEPQQLFDALVEKRLELKRPTLFKFSLHVDVGKVWILRTMGVQKEGEYKPLEEE